MSANRQAADRVRPFLLDNLGNWWFERQAARRYRRMIGKRARRKAWKATAHIRACPHADTRPNPDAAVHGARICNQCGTGIIDRRERPDHLCRVRCCVNPDHLEPVTPAENNRRRPKPGPLRRDARSGRYMPDSDGEDR